MSFIYSIITLCSKIAYFLSIVILFKTQSSIEIDVIVVKNLNLEKHRKWLDMEKWLEDHILEIINTENLLRRDL